MADAAATDGARRGSTTRPKTWIREAPNTRA